MMSSKLMGLLAIVLLLSTPTLSSFENAISCPLVIGKLTPCLGFVKGDKGTPSSQCCLGVKDLADEIKDNADKQAACQCIKSALSSVNYQPGRIPALGKDCGASINLPPIDKNTDCTKFSWF